MLSAAEIDEMRATIAQTFSLTAEVRRPVTAPDGMGGQTTTWQTVATVPCALAPLERVATEQVRGGQPIPAVTWQLLVPVQTDLRASDLVVVGTETFEVAAVLAPETRELARRALLVKGA